MAWRRTSQLTLRISIQQNAEAVAITLEGRIAGPWAAELSRTWLELAPSLGKRKLSIDLCNATYADANGPQTLSDICSEAPVEFIPSPPWTKYLAEEITRQSATRA